MPALYRAALVVALAIVLSVPGAIPTHAGTRGKDDLLQAGVTAAAVAGLLGPAASQILSVGAKPLAPRIAKDIVRGKKLPPGIGKQAVPPTLLHRLPGLDGHEWARIGTDLVLVAVATQVVAQVITDVFS
ncbi:RcnB family protein [Aerophototrophica crusticola]|uniref:RcnB family protein n=1 Tax=Aerophototrophica crusticola TaxID=1709002 RepID=A0A858R5X6_9PROT|nr:RcnB family protein [Rhodospirillaceae bacterium B3]